MLVLTIVDRLEGAKENFAAEKLEFRALYTADEFLKALAANVIPADAQREPGPMSPHISI